jgi:transcriptional regulator with XRE-family HTH domain
MNVTFSTHLSQLMADRGWKAADLARESGLSHVAIGNYLKGRIPKYKEAQKIAAVFGVSPDYLLNPERYTSPLKMAAEIAKQAAPKDRQRMFEIAERALSEAMLPKEGEGLREDMPVYGSGVIDWRARAIDLEKQLLTVKDQLGKITQTIDISKP